MEGPPAVRLLEVRSALVATRNRWERLDDDAVRAGRRALAAAKGLAIEL